MASHTLPWWSFVVGQRGAFGSARQRAGVWAREALCRASGGHDYLLHIDSACLRLQCGSCGHETPGWDVAAVPPSPPAARTRQRAGMLVMLALTLSSLPALAQVPQTPYDVMHETRITGVVLAVELRSRDGGPDVVLTIDAAGARWMVHVGPAVFVEDRKMVFRPGDEVTIDGYRTYFERAAWMLAREIAKGGVTLKLRTESGWPMWVKPTTATHPAGSVTNRPPRLSSREVCSASDEPASASRRSNPTSPQQSYPARAGFTAGTTA